MKMYLEDLLFVLTSLLFVITALIIFAFLIWLCKEYTPIGITVVIILLPFYIRFKRWSDKKEDEKYYW